MRQGLAGQTLGRYKLHRLLGQGGMASVYLAQVVGERGFERWVALKVIHPHSSDDPRFVRMFLNEARLSARLYHPNVCTVFDYGQVDETHYIAMEYLPGETLGAVMRARAPRDIVVKIVIDAARGLHAAHELRGEDGQLVSLVHRDVSPHNVLVLYDGLAKVVDFGIARARDQVAETTTGSVKGKLAYMAPEQLNSRPIDRRTDIFALGIVAWEATLGWRLFKRNTAAATFRAALEEPIPQPSSIAEDYPPSLERTILKALARDPDQRWQTMEELANALESDLLDSQTPTMSSSLSQWMKRTFADQIAEREAWLHAPAEEDQSGSAAAAATEPTQDTVPTEDILSTSRERQRPSSRGPWLVAGVSVIVALTVVLLFGRAALFPPPEVTRAMAPTADGGQLEASHLAVATAGADASPVDSAVATEGSHRADADRPEAAAAAQGDPAPVKARRRPGFINVVSIPVAEVWLGGRRLGQTPLMRLKVRPGRHVLLLKAVGGGGERRAVVNVRPGKVSPVSVRFPDSQ